VVCGVDKRHNEQLQLTLPTWLKHKPTLQDVPFIVFYDRSELDPKFLSWLYDQHANVTLQAWPFAGVEYQGDVNTKFFHPQRYQMLAGFVHVPALFVETDYWLKIDTDTVAVGPDDWIDEAWFKGWPVIVAHRWGLTKPPDQILKLDQWGNKHPVLSRRKPLNLVPEEGADKLKHPRIISWCAFFETHFTRWASEMVDPSDRWGMPVPSQDGYLWYLAERMGWGIRRVNMKEKGWQHWTTNKNIRNAVQESMK
jgi:hypothetical protein